MKNPQIFLGNAYNEEMMENDYRCRECGLNVGECRCKGDTPLGPEFTNCPEGCLMVVDEEGLPEVQE
jgi:hypothetical protein